MSKYDVYTMHSDYFDGSPILLILKDGSQFGKTVLAESVNKKRITYRII